MIKPGDLVKAGYQGGPMLYTGIVTKIADVTGEMHYDTMVHVLCDGTIKFFALEEDNIEVIK